MLVLAGCENDSPSADPPTQSAPSTSAAAGAAAARCPLPPLPGGVSGVTTKAGDFDGNGVADTLRAYSVGGEWHLRVELAGGQSGDDLVVEVDPATGLKAVGGFNLGGSGADEALATVSSGPVAASIAVFAFTDCNLDQVTVNGRTATFVVEATAERRTGLRCVAGTGLQVLNAEQRPRTTTFTTNRVTFNLVGSTLTQVNASAPETYPAGDPMLAPFGRLDCGSLALS
jgi:hypothetical protein